jgi:hypothetical protein
LVGAPSSPLGGTTLRRSPTSAKNGRVGGVQRMSSTTRRPRRPVRPHPSLGWPPNASRYHGVVGATPRA